MATNPLLAELANLSPGAKSALLAAHTASQSPAPPDMNAGMQAPKIPQSIAHPSQDTMQPPPLQSTPSMGTTPQAAMHVADSVPNIEQAPKVVAAPYSKGTVEGDTAERQRLINTGSGVSQIKNPFLKTLATVGDTVGSIAAPGLLAAIPGTNLHHNRLLAENNRDLTTDIGNAQKEAQTGLIGAQETNQEALPELNRVKAENAQQKQDLAETKQQQTHEHQQTQDEQTLRQHGFARDQSGNIVPVPYEQLSPNEQAAHDLRSSQQELADANKQLREAQTANIPQQVELAKQRIATAQQNSSIAAGRLGLSQQQFGFNQEKYYNPQPTAAERKTGDLAQSAVNQVKTMRSIVNAHPDIFGPGAGREQRIETWMGTQSPEAAKFKSAQTYLAEHSAGVFGARAASIVHDLKDLTSPTSNPGALHAALDQAESTAQHFVDTGKLHGKGESGPNTPSGTTKHSVGDVVSIKGRKMKITAVHPDGSFDAE